MCKLASAVVAYQAPPSNIIIIFIRSAYQHYQPNKIYMNQPIFGPFVPFLY